VLEWSNRRDWKSRNLARGSWVRIPPSPPPKRVRLSAVQAAAQRAQPTAGRMGEHASLAWLSAVSYQRSARGARGRPIAKAGAQRAQPAAGGHGGYRPNSLSYSRRSSATAPVLSLPKGCAAGRGSQRTPESLNGLLFQDISGCASPRRGGAAARLLSPLPPRAPR
jgi:hypothetical protein